MAYEGQHSKPKVHSTAAQVTRAVVKRAGPVGKAAAVATKKKAVQSSKTALKGFFRGTTIQSSARGFSAMQIRSSRRILIATWIVSLLIVAIEPLSGKKDLSATQIMHQAGAVFFAYWILGVISVFGARPARWSAMFGGLIMLGLMLSKRDALNNLFQDLAGNQQVVPATTG